MPMPASMPLARRRSRSATQRVAADMREHLVDDGVIVAAVVLRAAGDEIGKLVLADEIAPAHFDAVEPECSATLSIAVSMA